ncbi:hypothetical protein EIP91_009859, partial [Steccherinum ochraceum]
ATFSPSSTDKSVPSLVMVSSSDLVDTPPTDHSATAVQQLIHPPTPALVAPIPVPVAQTSNPVPVVPLPATVPVVQNPAPVTIVTSAAAAPKSTTVLQHPSVFKLPLPKTMATTMYPLKGSRKAPKTFKGKSSQIKDFIEEYDVKLTSLSITDETEKKKNITRLHGHKCQLEHIQERDL